MLQSLPGNLAQLRIENVSDETADAVFVDVRSPDEIAETGSIEGALNIPLESMLEMRDEWPAQEASIIVYDADGYRGNLAMTVLRTYGYRNVRNLSGGLNAWIEAGHPVATD